MARAIPDGWQRTRCLGIRYQADLGKAAWKGDRLSGGQIDQPPPGAGAAAIPR